MVVPKCACPRRQSGSALRGAALDNMGADMAKAFGFNEEELKLLLVAVRHMRRTFAQPRRDDPSIEAYAQLYDALFEKLRDMAGPLPDSVEGVIE